MSFTLRKKLFCSLFFLILLQGCATPPLADSIAREGNLQRMVIPAGNFVLTAYGRAQDMNAPITIYIEGEDRPFAQTASINPPPQNLIALRLASLDPSPNVVYLARPCQITANDPACRLLDTDTGRYADQVVASMGFAINRIIVPLTTPRIHLVGYSTGGAVAALLAARRADVVSLRTVAGNMDPYGLARYLGYDGADDLLDPMPIAKRLTTLPQEHFSGTMDNVVPAFLTANFLKELGATYCTTMVRVPGAAHNEGWENIWPLFAGDPPACGKPVKILPSVE